VAEVLHRRHEPGPGLTPGDVGTHDWTATRGLLPQNGPRQPATRPSTPAMDETCEVSCCAFARQVLFP
jgi:hypothetical protein